MRTAGRRAVQHEAGEAGEHRVVLPPQLPHGQFVRLGSGHLPAPYADVKAIPKAQAGRFGCLEGGSYGGTRRVPVAGGAGHRYKSGRGMVPLRWVFIRDSDGTHRDGYFFTTDLALTPAEVIGYYTARWNLETTFEELRVHLGLETTRGRCPSPVLRAAP
jgi:hypothetical protein